MQQGTSLVLIVNNVDRQAGKNTIVMTSTDGDALVLYPSDDTLRQLENVYGKLESDTVVTLTFSGKGYGVVLQLQMEDAR